MKPAPHADGPQQHFGLGLVHLGTGTLHSNDALFAALEDLTKALKKFPENARLLTSAAVLHGRQGRVECARELFKRGRAIDPRNAVLLRVCLSNAAVPDRNRSEQLCSSQSGIFGAKQHPTSPAVPCMT